MNHPNSLRALVATTFTVAASLLLAAWFLPRADAKHVHYRRQSCDVADELVNRVDDLDKLFHPDAFLGDDLTGLDRAIKKDKLVVKMKELSDEYRGEREREQIAAGKRRPEE